MPLRSCQYTLNQLREWVKRSPDNAAPAIYAALHEGKVTWREVDEIAHRAGLVLGVTVDHTRQP